MSQPPFQQLDKVLALADSSHEGEAVVAIRKARQILSRDGLSFGDLARAAQQKPHVNMPFGFFSSQQMVNLEMEILQQRQKIDDLHTALQAQTLQADMWRNRAAELEQKLNLRNADAERWRQLARDTVEKLWDLGQGIKNMPEDSVDGLDLKEPFKG
ncbi:MAG: hypothetical protein JO253_04810 [Alphaproteobacteria bacterium]|nr:hypothetical protein [Alphaproteobacteria bacterium]